MISLCFGLLVCLPNLPIAYLPIGGITFIGHLHLTLKQKLLVPLSFFVLTFCVFLHSSCLHLGFPVQTGRVSLVRHVKSAETACKVVEFPPFSFYPDKEVHVQITTNHWNISRKNFIHDATVSWVHTVNYKNFEVNIENNVLVYPKGQLSTK